jgi:hypothetical protein
MKRDLADVRGNKARIARMIEHLIEAKQRRTYINYTRACRCDSYALNERLILLRKK